MSVFSGLHPDLQEAAEYLLLVAQYNGLNPIVTSVRRSYASQRRLYDLRQRTLAGTLRPGEKPQRYPVAPPGTSDHEIGFAFDLVCDDQAGLGKFWQGMGGSWNAGDAIHYFVR